MKEKRYYMAYGSNLSMEQMAVRCPDAKVVGTAVLCGWRLLFKGFATIEPCEGKNTPVLVWEISERDERNLDRYEGYPSFYYKKELEAEVFPMEGGEPVKLTAMVYIMDEKRSCGEPSDYYYGVLENGYRDFHFPMHVLTQALKDSRRQDGEYRRQTGYNADAFSGETIEEFLKDHTASRVELMTPGGAVNLNPDRIRMLLEGESVAATAGDSETFRMASADELLRQKIISGSWKDGVWHFMTDEEDE